jgi:hypothetical protein
MAAPETEISQGAPGEGGSLGGALGTVGAWMSSSDILTVLISGSLHCGHHCALTTQDIAFQQGWECKGT